MMRTVTYWEAEDGTKFNSDYDCDVYEKSINIERIAKKFLIPQHHSWNSMGGPPFSDADHKWHTSIRGYIQQSKTKCFEFRKMLGEMSYERCHLEHFLEKYLGKKNKDYPDGWVPFGHTPLVRLCEELPKDYWQFGWFRIACIDRQFREYEQPFFAEHPEEAAKQRSNQIG